MEREPHPGAESPVAPSRRRSDRAIVGPAAALIRTHAGALVRTAGLVAVAGAVPVAILTDFVAGAANVAEGTDVLPPAVLTGQAVATGVEFLLSALVLVVALQVFAALPRPLDLRRPVAAMGAYLLSLAAAGLPLVAAGLLGAAVSAVAGPGESMAGLIVVLALMTVAVVGAVYVYASLALSMIVVIREEAGVATALRASWRRMPGHRLRWLGGQIVLGLLLLPVLALTALLFNSLPIFAAALLFTTVNSLGSAAVIGAVATVVYADTAPPEPPAVETDLPASGV